MKRILSWFLVIAMLLAYLPAAPAAAVESDTNTEELQFSEDTSFGNLLNNSLSPRETGDEGLECLITSLEFQGKTAKVTVNAPVDALLVVAIYDETQDTMLASGTANAAAGEQQLQVTINIDTMPQYYRGKAFLLDKETNAPLSQTKNYEFATKGYRDIAEATVTDFPAEKVINLDENKDTNFAVLRSGVVKVDGSRIRSNGDGSYTITSATEAEKKLQVGDVILATMADGSVLTVKAASVSVSGSTVVLVEDATIEALDVFEMLKLDIDSDDYGLEALHDTRNASAAGDPIKSQEWDVVDGTLKFDMPEGVPSSIDMPISVEVQYYTSDFCSYYSGKINYALEVEIDLASIDEKELVELEWEPRLSVPTNIWGLSLESEGEFEITLEAGCSYKLSLSGSLGKEYYGRNGKFYDISSRPKFNQEVGATGGVTISFAMGMGVAFGRIYSTDIALAELSVGGKTALSIEVSASWDGDISEKIHVCGLCGSLDISMGLYVEAELGFVIFEWEGDFPIRKKPIAKAHFCLPHDPFDLTLENNYHGGWTECQRFAYKVSFVAQDAENNILSNAQVTLTRADGEALKVYKPLADAFAFGYMPLEELVTDSSGNLSCYLENGSYLASVGGKQIPFTVSGSPRSVSLVGNETPSEPGVRTLEIRINPRIMIGEKVSLRAVLRFAAGEQDVTENVTWALEDSSIAEISGLSLEAKNKGTTVLHATFTDLGQTYTASAQIQALEVIDQGNVGDFRWVLDSDYVLTVTGEGSMYSNPWSAYNARIKGVIIGEGITSLAAESFRECVSLETVSLPTSLKSISGSCFAYCSSLSYIYIPKNVSSIQGSAFEGCTSLQTIEVDPENPYFKVVDGMVLSADRKKLIAAPYLLGSVLRVPETVLQIEDYACTGLAITTLELPDTLRVVGYRAFQYCTQLETVSVYTPSIDPGKVNVSSIQSYAFEGCTALKNLQIPSGISFMGFDTFKDCVSLTSLVLPDHITEMNWGCFRNCTGLTAVTLPQQLDHLGSLVFSGCTALEEILIPDSVTYIGPQVFENCTALKRAKLPKSLKGFGNHLFYNCPSLVEVQLPEDLEHINASAFQGCISLPQIDIPETVTIIYSNAFDACYNLSDVELPAGIKRLESYAFQGCRALTELELPEGLETINFGALAGAGLVSVVIPDSVTELGMAVFGNCKNLRDVTVGSGITKLAGVTFGGSTVQEIYFRGILTEKLDWSDFNDCENLTDIYYAGSESQWPGVTVLDPYNPPLEGVTIYYDYEFPEEPAGASSSASGSRAANQLERNYTGLKPGMEYVLVMLSDENAPITAKNLLYIDQKAASAEGTLSFRFTPKSLEGAVLLIGADGKVVVQSQPEKIDNPFVDVFEADYYYDPVLWAVSKGITNGMDATHFAPEGTCTRAQIVTFLWRANGSPVPASGNNPFTDVAAGQWYTDAVLWAVEKGITTGTSATTFSPDDGCTRGQVATFLWRSEGQPASGGENIFTDITPGAYYYAPVLWAVENGITNGMGDGTFAPDATCTRGQIVTFLYRAMA